MSRSDTIAFTDDDCWVPPDWLMQIGRAFDREPGVDLIYGRVVQPKGLISAELVIPDLPFNRVRKLSPACPFELYGMGANFAIRRRLVDEIGGFDEMLGAGCRLPAAEDFDLQYRAYLGGATRLIDPEICVEHYGARTMEQWPRTIVSYAAGNAGFYMKHARCRDGRAICLLLQHLTREVGRLALGRPFSRDYMQGFIQGMWTSLRIPVDVERRLYGGTRIESRRERYDSCA